MTVTRDHNLDEAWLVRAGVRAAVAETPPGASPSIMYAASSHLNFPTSKEGDVDEFACSIPMIVHLSTVPYELFRTYFIRRFNNGEDHLSAP